MMPGAHCEGGDKENAARNARPQPTKKFEQKDSENDMLRRENEKLRNELEKLRNEKHAAAETVRAAASPVSQWRSTNHESVGQRVRRFFPDHPTTDGDVRMWRPATEDGGSQFHCVHDDGDEETLDEDELEAAIAAYALGHTDFGLSVDPPSDLTVIFPFATTSGRSGAATKLVPVTATLCRPDATDKDATGRVGEYVLLYGKQRGQKKPERRVVVFRHASANRTI